MSFSYGTVQVVHPDGGVSIRFDGGRDLLVSAASLGQYKLPPLRAGARLRVKLENDAVTGLILLSQGGDANDAGASQAERIPAHITAMFPGEKRIRIESEQGAGEYSRVDLAPERWASLRVGSPVFLLRLPDGKVRLELPHAEAAPGVGVAVAHPGDSVDDPPRTGVISHLGAFHGVVKGDDVLSAIRRSEPRFQDLFHHQPRPLRRCRTASTSWYRPPRPAGRRSATTPPSSRRYRRILRRGPCTSSR